MTHNTHNLAFLLLILRVHHIFLGLSPFPAEKNTYAHTHYARKYANTDTFSTLGHFEAQVST